MGPQPKERALQQNLSDSRTFMDPGEATSVCRKSSEIKIPKCRVSTHLFWQHRRSDGSRDACNNPFCVPQLPRRYEGSDADALARSFAKPSPLSLPPPDIVAPLLPVQSTRYKFKFTISLYVVHQNRANKLYDMHEVEQPA